MEDEVEGIADERQVLQLVEETWKDYADRAREAHNKAVRNRRYLMGEHYGDVVASTSRRRGPSVQSQIMPEETRNYMRKLRGTWAARITEEAPLARAFPSDPAGTDLAAARVSNAYIENVVATMEWPSMVFQAAMIAQSDGSAIFKNHWDPDRGKRSEFTGEPMGDVRTDLFDIFSCGISDDDPGEATWCFFERLVDKYEARDLINSGMNPGEEPNVEHMRSPGGEVVEDMFKVTEIWYRPGPRFRDGLYAVVCAGNVVDVDVYPYEHRELPISVWRLEPIKGTPFGDTHVNDAVPLQRQVNKLFSAIVRLTDEVGNMRLLARPEITQALRRKNQVLPIQSLDIIKGGWAWMEPPQIPRLLSDQMEENVSALHDLYGQNELLVGRSDTEVSGKALAYHNRLDGLALSGPLRELNGANKRTVRQWLYLAQQFIEEERYIAIGGFDADEEPEVLAFTGADIAGATDVRIEAAPSTVHTSMAGSDEATSQMEAGIISPEEGIERKETGLEMTSYGSAVADLVRGQVDQIRQGGQAVADSTIDPKQAIMELSKAISLEMGQGRPAGDPVIQQLMRLISEYRSVLARAASGAQGGQAARQQGFAQQESQAEQALPLQPQ